MALGLLFAVEAPVVPGVRPGLGQLSAAVAALFVAPPAAHRGQDDPHAPHVYIGVDHWTRLVFFSGALAGRRAKKSRRMHKSRLNHLARGRGVSYRVVDRTGPSHAPTFTCECEFDGETYVSGPQPTVREAENDAAARALGLPPTPADVPAPATTVLIDGDNVHEVGPWLARTAPEADVHLFVEPHAVVRNVPGRVHRARTTLPDATDMRMVVYATRLAATLEDGDELVLVSRDRIFKTFVAELDHPRVRLVTQLGEFF